MSAQVETSVQAEGADDLKQFLNQHESSLKNSINAIYDVLKKAGLDKDDLLQFETIDLRKTLEDEGLKNLHIGRLINALKKIPESEIFKKSSTSKVVVLSSEEESALNNIKIKSKQFKQNAQIITNTLNELNTCYKNEQNMINTEFNKMLDAMNKRKNELLQKLTNMKNNKNDVLMKQLNSVKEYDAKLVQCYEESQKMIHSVSFDDAKRKTKILSITSQMLQDSKQFDDFTLGTTVKMHVQIDTNKIINTLKITGNITDAILEAPALTVKNVKSNSVRVNIKNKGDIIGHKLKYAEFDGNEMKEAECDMKLEWRNIEIENSNKDIDHDIGGLKECTHYMISALSKNKYGYGNTSGIMKFQTKKKSSFIFDVITNGYSDWISDNGKTFTMKEKFSYVTASCSHGYNSGIHQFKIKITGESHLGFAVIADSIHKSKSSKYINQLGNKVCVLDQNGNILENDGRVKDKMGKLKQNDVITMILNCNEWKLTYDVNGNAKSVSIAKDHTYYACVCAWEKDVKVAIL
eukprot:318630_1